jgi:hypothetical protein
MCYVWFVVWERNIWKDEVGSEESCERERKFQVPTYSHVR